MHLANILCLARIPDHLTMIDPVEHTKRKKIVNHLYSTSFVSKSEEHIESVIDLFMEKLDGFAQSGETIDLLRWLQMQVASFTMDATRQFANDTFQVRLRCHWRDFSEQKARLSRERMRLQWFHDNTRNCSTRHSSLWSPSLVPKAVLPTPSSYTP